MKNFRAVRQSIRMRVKLKNSILSMIILRLQNLSLSLHSARHHVLFFLLFFFSFSCPPLRVTVVAILAVRAIINFEQEKDK